MGPRKMASSMIYCPDKHTDKQTGEFGTARYPVPRAFRATEACSPAGYEHATAGCGPGALSAVGCFLPPPCPASRPLDQT